MAAPLLLLALTIVAGDPDTTIHLPRNGAVEIDTRMRDITLRVGEGDLVTIRGGEAELDGGTLQISDDRRTRNGTGMEITVPSWARVEVTSVGGNLTFTGTPEQLHAETVNGFIHVMGGTGTVELETVAGGVLVRDFHGTSLSIDGTGDNISVTNLSGALTVDNVNGDVILREIRSSTVSASSINGMVQFDGVLSPSGRYDFASQNRDVTLWLPADVSARLKISTMNGELTTQIPATSNGMPGPGSTPAPDKGKDKGKHGARSDDDGEQTYTVVYGSGSARVSIDAFNGNIIVKKRP